MKRIRDEVNNIDLCEPCEEGVPNQHLQFVDVGLRLVSPEYLVDPHSGSIIAGIVGTDEASASVALGGTLATHNHTLYDSSNHGGATLVLRRAQNRLQPVARGFPALQFFSCPTVAGCDRNSLCEELSVYYIQDNRSQQAPCASLLMDVTAQQKSSCPAHFFPCSCKAFQTVGIALRRLYDEFNAAFDWDVYVCQEEERRNRSVLRSVAATPPPMKAGSSYSTESVHSTQPQQKPTKHRPTLSAPKHDAYCVGSGLQLHVEIKPIASDVVRAPDLWYQVCQNGDVEAIQCLYESILAGQETRLLEEANSREEILAVRHNQAMHQWGSPAMGYAPLAVILFLNVSADVCAKPASPAANPNPCTHALILITTPNVPLTLSRRIIGPIILKDSDTPLSIMSSLALHTGNVTGSDSTFPKCSLCKTYSSFLTKCPLCRKSNICGISAVTPSFACHPNQCSVCGIRSCGGCCVTVTANGVKGTKCLECLVLNQ